MWGPTERAQLLCSNAAGLAPCCRAYTAAGHSPVPFPWTFHRSDPKFDTWKHMASLANQIPVFYQETTRPNADPRLHTLLFSGTLKMWHKISENRDPLSVIRDLMDGPKS